jgi:hypothetical protein
MGLQGPAGPQGLVGAQGLPGLGAFAAENAAAGTTNSTAYTGTLAGTPGTNPSVTVSMTGSSAIVIVTAHGSNGMQGLTYVSFTVSGASSVGASDDRALIMKGEEAGSAIHYLTGLTAGDNTFALQYKVGANTGTFAGRNIIVIPMP